MTPLRPETSLVISSSGLKEIIEGTKSGIKSWWKEQSSSIFWSWTHILDFHHSLVCWSICGIYQKEKSGRVQLVKPTSRCHQRSQMPEKSQLSIVIDSYRDRYELEHWRKPSLHLLPAASTYLRQLRISLKAEATICQCCSDKNHQKERFTEQERTQTSFLCSDYSYLK